MRKRLGNEFFDLLCSIKEISVYFNWEDCKPLLEGCQEHRSIKDESHYKEIFEEYISQLKQHAKENDNTQKEEKTEKKEREERRNTEKEEHFKKDGVENKNADVFDTLESKENKRLEKERSKKQRKRQHSGE